MLLKSKDFRDLNQPMQLAGLARLIRTAHNQWNLKKFIPRATILCNGGLTSFINRLKLSYYLLIAVLQKHG